MGRNGREDGTSATRTPRLLPVLTPVRCCWPGETTFSLSFHSPEIKEKLEYSNLDLLNLRGLGSGLGLPRADVFYPGNAATELTEDPIYDAPSVVNFRGFWPDLGTREASSTF